MSLRLQSDHLGISSRDLSVEPAGAKACWQRMRRQERISVRSEPDLVLPVHSSVCTDSFASKVHPKSQADWTLHFCLCCSHTGSVRYALPNYPFMTTMASMIDQRPLSGAYASTSQTQAGRRSSLSVRPAACVPVVCAVLSSQHALQITIHKQHALRLAPSGTALAHASLGGSSSAAAPRGDLHPYCRHTSTYIAARSDDFEH